MIIDLYLIVMHVNFFFSKNKIDGLVPIFVSKLDTSTYISLVPAARVPKLSQLLQYYVGLLPTSFWRCDLINMVTRGHERSQNSTFACGSYLTAARLPRLLELLQY